MPEDEGADRCGDGRDMVKPREGVRLLELYESQMLNKTYLNIEPKKTRRKIV